MRWVEIRPVVRGWKYLFIRCIKIRKFPNVHSKARLGMYDYVVNPDNLVLHETATLKYENVIMNGRSRFIIKKWSGAAEQLMVIPGNHMFIPGVKGMDVSNEVKDSKDIGNDFDKDVVVDEDVWIGARVIILQGVHVGRGCTIGAGTVLRKSTPPYSIVIGNPAKVVGFRFTPEEIIAHEEKLYPEEERLPLSLLEKNYEKYFLSKIKEIKKFTSLTF